MAGALESPRAADEAAEQVETAAAPGSRLLNMFVDRALATHALAKLDQRIAKEWEVVEDVDTEEYVFI
ncbi:hypothetical protein GPECTOR_3g466 [Gonium pectorale]|uniref:Uncharacterized protein n=1 Tax=Gonium pectorale TaxID=33097 RepID=A0A150GZX7_GONPE|nr:hypothetical protein GPECTOR_3g466 [Gonium pectorale]|eukprot:KXZ55334.1 hypothetical protein GPECTOR_3g466 [Gonium pectorale]